MLWTNMDLMENKEREDIPGETLHSFEGGWKYQVLSASID